MHTPAAVITTVVPKPIQRGISFLAVDSSGSLTEQLYQKFQRAQQLVAHKKTAPDERAVQIGLIQVIP
jgi:hypothetical protein